MAPVSATDTNLIRAQTPTDLALPAASVPPDFTPKVSASQPITTATMRPVLGKHVTLLFLKDGWTAGFHGWLDARQLQGDAFITYDFYGFKDSAGARAAAKSYLGLILGVQTQNNERHLPRNATLFIDGTGAYGPSGQPFTVVEIAFRVNNVLADVTGYYAGSSASATDAARKISVDAGVSLFGWLQSQSHPAKHATLLLPLLPVALITARLRPHGLRLGA
jgi:hypothetical protein